MWYFAAKDGITLRHNLKIRRGIDTYTILTRYRLRPLCWKYRCGDSPSFGAVVAAISILEMHQTWADEWLHLDTQIKPEKRTFITIYLPLCTSSEVAIVGGWGRTWESGGVSRPSVILEPLSQEPLKCLSRTSRAFLRDKLQLSPTHFLPYILFSFPSFFSSQKRKVASPVHSFRTSVPRKSFHFCTITYRLSGAH